MRIAVVGATGLVGSEILKVLQERSFAYDELLLVASERSAGKKIDYNGKTYTVIGMEEAIEKKPHMQSFSPAIFQPESPGAPPTAIHFVWGNALFYLKKN